MRDNIGDFLDSITESDFNRLETLMLDKYYNFLQLYWMLRSYASEIRSIKYKESEKNKLTVTIDAGSGDNRDRILSAAKMHEKADSYPEGKRKIIICMIG